MRGRLGVVVGLGLAIGLGLGGCTVDSVPQYRPDSGDSPADGGDVEQPPPDHHKDAGPGHVRDAGEHDRDAELNPDAGPDAEADAAHDAGADGGDDSAVDAGDSGQDSGPDLDPCASLSCGDHAHCEESAGAVECSCDSSYQDNDGDHVCAPACASDSCPDHSSCADGSGAVVCTCRGGYQDNDSDGSCLPACGAGKCPTHSTCSDSTGTLACSCATGYSGPACSDTNACAVADVLDGNPCNALDLSATCMDDLAPAITYRCSCGTGFISSSDSCADVDECADHNGGCGDAQFNHCANNVGAPPDCTDIDECADHNGGCGDAQFYDCDDNVGAPPDCTDIDECAHDNGHCGNPLRATCIDNEGAPPTCDCADQYGGVECAYHQVYGLDLPAVSPAWVDADQIPYDIDNTASLAPFDRVAYRLQLDDQWIWVEVDAFTNEPSSLGIPADEIFDQKVDHMTVRTNSPNVSEVSDADGGKIEFWSNCYSEGPDAIFNDDDERGSPDCFGSLQLHRDGSTLLAVNHWAFGAGDIDVGIGNGVPPDWTFAGNAGSYTTRRLEVFVRELASCRPDSCNGHGSCSDSSGIVQCQCSQGYDGVLCKQCANGYQDNNADGVCEPRCAPGDCSVPGEYCFDDSGTTECLSSEGAGCAAILLADAQAGDGTYVVDVDGAGGNDPLLAYCDMSHGGYSLLAVANARSGEFGNNGPAWAQSSTFGSTSIGLAGGDYKGRAYSELATATVRLCYADLDHCHDFAHGLGISLQAFFANNVSYDEYAANIYGHANVGADSARMQYLDDLGASEAAPLLCGYWLGINEQAMHSGIGLMGDKNDGCGAGTNNHWIDDLAIGVGLQSCADTNACPPLGTKNTAGRQSGWVGESGDLGPWFMLGR